VLCDAAPAQVMPSRCSCACQSPSLSFPSPFPCHFDGHVIRCHNSLLGAFPKVSLINSIFS
jgi:hypothetical protein